MSAPLFLTLEEVAERWRCSKKTVARIIDRGELRACRFGRMCVRVRLDDLERYEARLAGAESRVPNKEDPYGGRQG